jgi:hypothetical protein
MVYGNLCCRIFSLLHLLKLKYYGTLTYITQIVHSAAFAAVAAAYAGASQAYAEAAEAYAGAAAAYAGAAAAYAAKPKIRLIQPN